MANVINHKEGTPVVFADTTDYSSTASGLTRTDQLDLTSIATTAARQSAKADLGALRARLYAVRVAIEFATAPTAGTMVEFYWSPSFSSTAATGNDGGCSGSDAAYAPGGGAEADIDEFKRHLIFLGCLVATADATTTVQYATIGYFTPPHRYGQVVVKNKTAVSFHSDAVEMYVALVPILDEIQ